MLMNICVVRVLGPDVAKVRVPRALVATTGSSCMGCPRYFCWTLGSPLMPVVVVVVGNERGEKVFLVYRVLTETCDDPIYIYIPN